PEYLYVYVTSQGGMPPSLTLKDTRELPQRPVLEAIIKRFPELDQFLLRLDAMADGSTPPFEKFLLALHQDRSTAADLLLSPKYFSDALRAWPAETPKKIVLNSSYSGGFIEAADEMFEDDLITSVPGLTGFASARWDQLNPTLASSDKKTLFGLEFNRALEAHLGTPKTIDWLKLSSHVRQQIADAQRNRHQRDRSEPLFVPAP
ncbi:hypothetical protein K2X33_02940, partial [bacterium]|nr:hypothetical protein [bacterium]